MIGYCFCLYINLHHWRRLTAFMAGHCLWLSKQFIRIIKTFFVFNLLSYHFYFFRSNGRCFGASIRISARKKISALVFSLRLSELAERRAKANETHRACVFKAIVKQANGPGAAWISISSERSGSWSRTWSLGDFKALKLRVLCRILTLKRMMHAMNWQG